MQLLPCLALAQAFGIVLADRGWLSPTPAFCAGVVWLGIGAGAGRIPRLRALAALALACCAGALSLGVQLGEATSRRPAHPELRNVEARVSARTRGAGWSQVELGALRAVDGGGRLPRRVRVGLEPGASGGLALDHAPPGARVRARLRLRAPGGLRNPGSRDRRRELERAGIGAVARLAKPGLHVRLPERDSRAALAWVDALRSRVRSRLEEAGRGGGLIRALTLGDRSGLAPEVGEHLAALGLSHLLAVSGLHLALVAAGFFWAARLALGSLPALVARWDARPVALGVAVLAAVAYAALAGFGVPVRRALALVVALAVAVTCGRSRGRAAPLAAAALGILTLAPEALFLPGPQLSFAASAALLASLDRTQPGSRRGAVRTRLADLMRASATAIAATAPLAAWHMGRVAPLALPSNLVAIPWTSVVVLPASLAAAMAAALPAVPGSDLVIRAAAFLAEGSLDGVAWSAAMAPPSAPRPPPAPLAWWACIVVSAATLLARRTRTRVAGALALGGILSVAPPAPIDPPAPRVVFLDVGQGDATLVQGSGTPGPRVLVDAGTAIPDGLDLGRHAVVPALRALGVDALDLVVASHADLDHRGGLPAVIRALRVGQIWVPFGAADDEGFGALRNAAREARVPVLERGAGAESLDLGGLRVTPLWPLPGADGGSRNERSLVVGVEIAGRRVLLTGDIEANAEAALVARGADLRADVLKLAHHGSRSSSSEAFLRAVDPLFAVASAPWKGRFGMPHPEVLARTRQLGIPVWWTGRDGAVLIGLTGEPVVFGFAGRE